MGDGRFSLSQLPLEVQTAPVEGIAVDDFDGDGNLDVLMTGNSYATEAATGRYDAFIGALLKGNGQGTFENVSVQESGFLNDLDGSGLVSIKRGDGVQNILAANNDTRLKIFQVNDVPNRKWVRIEDNVAFAEIRLKNGKKYKKEFYFGSGYLSQNSRSMPVNENIQEIKVIDSNGNTKTVYLDEEIK